jgi:hypothetical protein
MIYALQSDDLRRCVSREIPSKTRGAGRKGGMLRRLLHLISEWDQTQADQAIGRSLIRSGGRLTDDLERRMMQRATATDWGVHG